MLLKRRVLDTDCLSFQGLVNNFKAIGLAIALPSGWVDMTTEENRSCKNLKIESADKKPNPSAPDYSS